MYPHEILIPIKLCGTTVCIKMRAIPDSPHEYSIESTCEPAVLLPLTTSKINGAISTENGRTTLRLDEIQLDLEM